tara:strand:- start:130 stop:852 length:723 start_codon:yes stop_codon:yes gene_type:complete
MQNSIVIIPARIGSKRIKKKNIKLFFKKPIISYAIKTAIKSKLFSKVVVSTDSEEIAKIAKKYGATDIVYRPHHLANDYATTIKVIQHAINHFERKKFKFKYVCCLYATSVLTGPLDLVKSYKKIISIKNKILFSSGKYSIIPEKSFILKGSKIKFLASLIYLKKNLQKILQRNTIQDKECYYDAGQFYWGEKKNFLSEKNILSEKNEHYLLPKNRAIDINDINDWYIAEALFSYSLKNK